jgi:hypothetical protein
MTNNLFDSQTIGSDPRWWTGIIVDDVSWKGNQLAEKWYSIDQLPGWGARYKVRIVGKHTQNKNKLPDDKLELCEVMYPVTAGTGHGASYQTSNLRKGSVVFGIYKDSEGNEPLIIGCIGNNSQTYLNAKQKNGFDPLIGLSTTPLYAVTVNPSGGPKSSKGETSSTIESNTPSTSTQKNITDARQAEDQRVLTNVPTTSKCEPIQLTGVALTIRNLIQDIEKVKKEVNDWRYKLTNELISENGQKFGLDEYIRYKVQNAAQGIVGWFKNLIFKIKERIDKNIEGAAKELYYFLFPYQRQKTKEALEKSKNLFNCLIRKIIGQLISILTKFLLDAVDRFINVPLCAAENILAAIIGKLTGLISSALDAIMAPVNALLGAVDLVGDVLQIVKDILTFLSCDDPPNCSGIKEWSIYDGPGQGLNLDLNSFFNKVKTFASNVAQSVNPDNFDFDLDFSDVFDNPCNVGAILCGPPTVEFFGGGGSGAAGNAIVSAAGQILGVDITLPGSNYTSAPFVRFVDACGKGRGAVGRVILGDVGLSLPTLPTLPTLPPDQPNNGKLPVYSITPSSTRVTEGDDIYFKIRADNVPNQTVLYYTITGTASSGDFDDNRLSGSFIVRSNNGFISKKISKDVLEENDEQFKVQIRTGSIDGEIVVESSNIIISDTINNQDDNNDDIDECIEGPQDTRSQKEAKKDSNTPPKNLGVLGVLMLENGSDYIPSPDGDIGGDGRVWAKANQTTIKRKNGTYDRPYDCGETIQVFCGDEISLPSGLCIELGSKTICGGNPVISHTKALITAPCYPVGLGTTDPGGDGTPDAVGLGTTGFGTTDPGGNGTPFTGSGSLGILGYPALGDGNYPVILYLCGLEIENSGFNYSETDKIVIEPSNVAVAVPTFGAFGTLEGVKIISVGEGFKEVPNVYIESETGFNAKLIPRFCIDRVSADQLKEPGIREQIISVVDCVGKVPQVDFFRVPR